MLPPSVALAGTEPSLISSSFTPVSRRSIRWCMWMSFSSHLFANSLSCSAVELSRWLQIIVVSDVFRGGCSARSTCGSMVVAFANYNGSCSRQFFESNEM